MFYSKPAMRIDANLFPVQGRVRVITAAASARGTDDPIVTIRSVGGAFEMAHVTLGRRFGTSPTTVYEIPPENYKGTFNLNDVPFLDESAGSGTTHAYSFITWWVKDWHPTLTASTTAPFGTFYNTRTTVTPGGKKPASPSNNIVNAPPVPLDYPDSRKYKIALSIVANQVSCSFTDRSSIETGFLLERSTDGGLTWPVSYVIGPRTGTGGVTYIDTAVVAGTTYTYRVKAVNSASLKDSAYTWPASISF